MGVLYESFQHNKIARLVRTSGRWYTGTVYKEDQYHEKTTEDPLVIRFKGVMHYSSAKASTSEEGTVTTVKAKTETLLCLYEDAAPLRIGSTVHEEATGLLYEVLNVNNLQEAGFACSIALRRLVGNGI